MSQLFRIPFNYRTHKMNISCSVTKTKQNNDNKIYAFHLLTFIITNYTLSLNLWKVNISQSYYEIVNNFEIMIDYFFARITPTCRSSG